LTVSAGCNSDFEREDLSSLDCPTLRRLLDDSSISARIASMSSEAEITGKRTTSRHPSARNVWKGLDFRLSGAVLEYRHSQKAGIARSSQRRFSKSSISRKWSGPQTCKDNQVFQKPGSGVNMTFVLWEERCKLGVEKHSYNGSQMKSFEPGSSWLTK
jgi:hypothetical protein